MIRYRTPPVFSCSSSHNKIAPEGGGSGANNKEEKKVFENVICNQSSSLV
jgi:hypothetical protein